LENVFLPGEKTSALCPTCQGRVQATFQYGTYTHSDGTKVPKVMMLFCDNCGTPLGHAQQSVYRIRNARQHDRLQKTTVRVPQVLLDIASSQVYKLGGDPKTVCAPEVVLKATLATIFDKSKSQRAAVIKLMKSCKDGPLWKQRQNASVPLKLSAKAKEELQRLTQESDCRNQSEAVRASILVAAEDDSPVNPELRKLVMLS
jgi:hypothetical protein